MLLPVVYKNTVDRALREDLAGGDMTTDATVESSTLACANAVARHDLVACGGELWVAVFRRVDPQIECKILAIDGEKVVKGATLWRVQGRARSILAAERVALNFVQRLTGIATLTRAFVDQIPAGCSTRLTDTRKTTPGLRSLERYAVRVGGGHNHRDSLGSAILIKDNHIVAAGGISQAVKRARSHAPHTSKIELEVDTLDQLDEALSVQADIIMLDNFSFEDTKEAVRRTHGRALLEVSGKVTIDRIRDIAELGIDVISVGALTHSFQAADIGLDMELL